VLRFRIADATELFHVQCTNTEPNWAGPGNWPTNCYLVLM